MGPLVQIPRIFGERPESVSGEHKAAFPVTFLDGAEHKELTLCEDLPVSHRYVAVVASRRDPLVSIFLGRVDKENAQLLYPAASAVSEKGSEAVSGVTRRIVVVIVDQRPQQVGRSRDPIILPRVQRKGKGPVRGSL